MNRHKHINLSTICKPIYNNQHKKEQQNTDTPKTNPKTHKRINTR